MSESKIARPFKGESIIAFPKEYIIIDIETTGLSPKYDSIIEISGLKYEKDTMVDEFSTLVRPENSLIEGIYVDSYITALTGISNDMLIEAPPTTAVLRKFKDFIGEEILIGHNVGFDINFLYDNFEQYLDCHLTNQWVNTQRIFRKLHPELEHHRLIDLSEYYHLDFMGSHRACLDSTTLSMCLRKMKSEILEKYGSLEEFQKTFKKHSGSASGQFHRYSAYDRIDSVPVNDGEIDPSNPLYKQVCVFTGALETMTRDAAMQMVRNYGGECGNNVTRKTNFLILGNMDYCTNIKDGKSNKLKKAEELKLGGQDIQIISESVFLDMVQEE